ncbi:MAG: chromosome segregation protein SMC, partial [Deltaproteobacteria bacterium]
PLALDEFETVKHDYDELEAQKADLTKSIHDLREIVRRINRESTRRFRETFDAINQQFQELFPRLFNGGQARLVLTDEKNLLETGIEIIAQPPGKRLQSINLFSGGEKAMIVISLIFSIFLIKPSPFCLLDEVDAPLDEVNVDRFNRMVRELSKKTQFILITHNKKTMETCDSLYGITMQEPGVSRVISMNLH